MRTGIVLKILATLAFTLMSVMAKLSAERYPLAEIVFFRSAFALAVVLAWLARRGGFPASLATDRPVGHFGRGVAGTCGMFCGFLSISLLPLPAATALGFASPLITVALAALMLGEKVRAYRWSAVGVGFLGVLVMLSEHLGATSLRSQAAASTIGATFALSGAVFAAIATVQTRRLTLSEPTGAIVFYFTLMTTLVTTLLLAAFSAWPAQAWGGAFAAGQAFVMPGARDMAALVAVGLFGGLGQILMTESFRHADASIIACFDYASMIWAVALGLLLFGETPSATILIGAGIVIATGLFVIWRERQLGLQRDQARSATPGSAL